MPPDVIDVKELGKQIEQTSLELKKAIEQRDAEIKANGKASEETGRRVDKIGETLEQMAADSKGAVEQSDAMKKRIDELEKKTGRPGMASFAAREPALSPGQKFAASEQYKAMLASGKGNADSVKVRSFFDRKADPYGALTLTGDSDAAALVVPYRVPEIIIPQVRPLMIRDLLTVASTSTGTIEYTEETGFAPLYTELAADALTGATTLTLESAAGFFAGQTVFVKAEEHTVLSVDLNADTITFAGGYGLLADYEAGDSVVSVVFAPTGEGRRKPQLALQYELKTLSTKTIAAWVPVSKQALADAGQLQSMIDTRLIYALGLSEEYQLLYGDGTGQNLQGILTHANVQTYSWSAGTVGDTRIDCIRRAMTLARLAEYPIDGVVLHPTDWEHIELVKGTDARYIWVQVGEGAQMRIWKAPVVDTTAIAAGEFCTGAFKLGATLYDQEQAAVDIAEQHADFFIKNMVAVRAEERLANALFRPEAFVRGTFDNAPV